MEYRVNRRTGDRISILGLGSGSMSFSKGIDKKNGIEFLRYAAEQGINFYDLCCGTLDCFDTYAQAHGDIRKNIIYQMHFGTDYATGNYGWTTDCDTIKRNVDLQLKTLKTDYIDYGFIHCIDEESDLKKYMDGGALDFLLDMTKQGVVRHLGLSSHTPEFVNKVLDMNLIDMLMFSVNPGYDYKHGRYAYGEADQRMPMYHRCVKEGVGISVMKPYAGGQLLDASLSPYGQPMTPYQCLQFALDKPGVLTTVPGVTNMEQLKQHLGFLEATPEERDYSVLGQFTPSELQGKCVYCQHCMPCPMELNIALINKYYDLAKAGDDMAKDHYLNLEKHAEDCVSCGHCNGRCPFHVDQMTRMQEIADYFGK